MIMPSDPHTRALSGDAADIADNPRQYFLADEAIDTEIGRFLVTLSQKERDSTLIIYMGVNRRPRAVIDTVINQHFQCTEHFNESGVGIPMLVSGAGVSFLSLLSSTDIEGRRFNYGEFINSNVTVWAVRSNDLKLVKFSVGRQEFYDFATNSREETNLIGPTNALANQLVELNAFSVMIRSRAGDLDG